MEIVMKKGFTYVVFELVLADDLCGSMDVVELHAELTAAKLLVVKESASLDLDRADGFESLLEDANDGRGLDRASILIPHHVKCDLAVEVAGLGIWKASNASYGFGVEVGNISVVDVINDDVKGLLRITDVVEADQTLFAGFNETSGFNGENHQTSSVEKLDNASLHAAVEVLRVLLNQDSTLWLSSIAGEGLVLSNHSLVARELSIVEKLMSRSELSGSRRQANERTTTVAGRDLEERIAGAVAA
jgi:hypothetical protein